MPTFCESDQFCPDHTNFYGKMRMLCSPAQKAKATLVRAGDCILKTCLIFSERNFMYQKNLIRSELLANYSTTKFIPVYMDFLSDLDIPSFLRNKKSFSLPSQLTELVLYIIGEPVCNPVSACPRQSLEEDGSLMKRKKILEGKIKNLNVKHQKKLRVQNNNMLAKVQQIHQYRKIHTSI